ncbi:hypothetical protein CCAL13119_08255 [Campylobacter sp. RM13119]|uniref:hypothetical protein n=1 Tax=Campylobacter TaxID=194 RepID=UPI001472F5BA|nr:MULTISPECIES: hypothetical protein [unclassified Campylobacter]MBE3606922.1 hypothetical protein [Campylobacter sp. RM13119]MBE3610014.1 hypothetical protein [Campylobacter sp. RM12916]
MILHNHSTALCVVLKSSKIASMGSALIGSLQYGSGVISSLVYAYFKRHSAVPMCVFIAFFTLLSFVVIFYKFTVVNLKILKR